MWGTQDRWHLPDVFDLTPGKVTARKARVQPKPNHFTAQILWAQCWDVTQITSQWFASKNPSPQNTSDAETRSYRRSSCRPPLRPHPHSVNTVRNSFSGLHRWFQLHPDLIKPNWGSNRINISGTGPLRGEREDCVSVGSNSQNIFLNTPTRKENNTPKPMGFQWEQIHSS